MKMKNVKKLTPQFGIILLSAIMISAVQSCIKDNFDLNKLTKIDYSPNLAVPLIYSSLTISDLLNKGGSQVVSVDANNFCSIIYRSNLFSLKASDVITLPNQTVPPFSTPLNTGPNPAGFTFTQSLPPQIVAFNTGTNGPLIDSIKFKTGSLDITINSDINDNGSIVIQIPSAKKNGVAFSKTILLTYTGTLPVTAVTTVDLAGYTFDMTVGGTASNQFTVNSTITLTGSGTPITPTDNISVSQSLNSISFAKIYGDIGQQSLTPAGTDSVQLSIFKSALGTGSFTLVDPRIKLIISNSYGVPINAGVNPFYGYTPGQPDIPVTYTGVPNYVAQLPIHSPGFNQIGQVLTDSFTLNNTNSNIATIVNHTPKYLIYKINSQTNPTPANHQNFVLDTSRFRVDMEVNLPLYGTAQNFTLQDTLPFTMQQTLTNDVESILFRTYNSNGFPFDVNLQVYFTDSVYTKLDSLVTPAQSILKSGVVTSGIVTSPTATNYDAVVVKSRLAHLKNTKHILIKAVANTTSTGGVYQNVKIYTYYKIDFKLGLQIQVKTKI